MLIQIATHQPQMLSAIVKHTPIWVWGLLAALLWLGVLLAKCIVGVELALQPALAHDTGVALQVAVLYGVFNGVFAARAARLWRLAQRTTASPQPLAST